MAVVVTPDNVRGYLDATLARDPESLPDTTINLPGYAARAIAEVKRRVTTEQWEESENEVHLSNAADFLTASYLAPAIPSLLGVFYAANAPGSIAPTRWEAKAVELRKRADEEMEVVTGEEVDLADDDLAYSGVVSTQVIY
jgi:hypothetical protein